jgi:outer membrane murein-binding lipoprotein Lpp
VDLKLEIELEREAKLKKTAECSEQQATVARLNSKLARLQHRFDTIQGIVQAAMDEANAERKEAEAKAEVYPWPAQERSYS